MPYILDDSEAALPIFSEVCSHCTHWIRKPGRKCHAFPDGIPLAIWLGENDHRTAFPGDHGIQFAPTYSSERRMRTRKPRRLVLALRVKQLEDHVRQLQQRLNEGPASEKHLVEIVVEEVTPSKAVTGKAKPYVRH